MHILWGQGPRENILGGAATCAKLGWEAVRRGWVREAGGTGPRRHGEGFRQREPGWQGGKEYGSSHWGRDR